MYLALQNAKTMTWLLNLASHLFIISHKIAARNQPGAKAVKQDRKKLSSRDQLTGPFIETAIRLGALALLLYWTLILVRPFISIVIWSVVLSVALYPVFEWMALSLADGVDWQPFWSRF